MLNNKQVVIGASVIGAVVSGLRREKFLRGSNLEDSHEKTFNLHTTWWEDRDREYAQRSLMEQQEEEGN